MNPDPERYLDLHRRSEIERAVVGAIRNAIDAHGPITSESAPSAAKSVIAALKQTRRRDVSPAQEPIVAGIDVGARRVHWVLVDRRGRIAGAGTTPADELTALAESLRGLSVVAVDAPAQISSLPHENDNTLSQKFQRGRCAEIALGRDHKAWVPWVAPDTAPDDGWMAVGFELFKTLAGAGIRAIEVYPHACFRTLAGGTLPPKKRPEGWEARLALLDAAGIELPGRDRRTHDDLDALVAALTALDVERGDAIAVTCGHDDSVIWLPASRPQAA